MNKNKWIEMVFVYVLFALLITSCSGIAPLQDGEVANLFSGMAKWMVQDGDALVKVFQNSTTGLTVYARPLADGWAVACTNGECPPVGYFMNIRTWDNLRTFLTGVGGFTWMNQLPKLVYTPSISMPTMFVIPITAYRDSSGHIWDDQLPCLSPALCWESDAGDAYWPPDWPTRGTVIENVIEVETIEAWAEVMP